MDPNANLEEQRKLAEKILQGIEDTVGELDDLEKDSNRLAELVQAMDEWLSGQGFYPEDWDNPDRKENDDDIDEDWDTLGEKPNDDEDE